MSTVTTVIVELIQLKRSTSATATSVNPILSIGEPFFETDTNRLKIGDGVTPYNSLSYLTGGGGGATVLSDLTDVSSALATNRNVLVGNGSSFVGRPLVEADISDLQSYLTAEVNDLTANVTWANVPDANITASSVTQHAGALNIPVIEGVQESPNNVTTQFTLTSGSYTAGSLVAIVNGQALIGGGGITETTPASGIFTFNSAPQTGASILTIHT